MNFNKRITTSWLAPTKNFRLSSRKLLGFYGTNVQNPSESFMRCIIPDEGHVLLQADQRGAEARVVAFECRPGKFRRLFELDINPHCYTVLQIYPDVFRGEYPKERYFKVDPDVLITYPEYKDLFKKIKTYRDGKIYAVGKTTRHAVNYKMGPRTAQINSLERSEGTINLTHQEWADILLTDAEVFPEIIELQNEIKNTLLSTRILRNCFGFPREFTGIWSEGLVRDGCAYNAQSTVGCITNMAFVEISNKIKHNRLPWFLLNNKHDSLLMSVPDSSDHIQEGAETLRKYLGKTLRSTKGVEYIMGVEVSKGYNWAKWHETNNPNGMKEI